MQLWSYRAVIHQQMPEMSPHSTPGCGSPKDAENTPKGEEKQRRVNVLYCGGSKYHSASRE